MPSDEAIRRRMMTHIVDRICRCRHKESQHQGPEELGGAQCLVCPEDGERGWLHPFILAEGRYLEELKED